MAESAAIEKLNHRHEGVLRWLLANPGKPLGLCAHELGYTLPWLSCIIHSDAFQTALQEAQGALREDVAASIHDKLTGLAHLSLDRLIETVPVAADPRFVLDTARDTLRNLGYGVQRPANAAPINATQVNVNITSDDLARARARIARAIEPIEGIPLPAPAPTS